MGALEVAISRARLIPHAIPSIPVVPRERCMTQEERFRMALDDQRATAVLRRHKLREAFLADARQRAERASLSLPHLNGAVIKFSFGNYASYTPEPSFASSFTMARVIREHICKVYGVSVTALASNRRQRHLCAARQHLMWLLRQETLWSLPQIGNFLGGRDHTTILYGVRQHQRRIDEGEVLA